MSKESRRDREFHVQTRKGIRRKSKGQDYYQYHKIETGIPPQLLSKEKQLDHILPIYWACLYIPDHKTEIIRSVANGALTEKITHTLKHAQMDAWPEWAKVNYTIGMYAYLEEEYYKNVMPAYRPALVSHRKLTDNKLVDIYVAGVGD